MVLVDTSVWISHFRNGSHKLARLLLEETVLCHPFIIGELACGHLKNRHEILSLLNTLPQGPIADQAEVLQFIENKGLMGRGIGLIDVHLLACALLTKSSLWTEDTNLQKTARHLSVIYEN